MNDHHRLDMRSLALHEAIAAKLLVRPELIDRAKANLARWQRGSVEEYWMKEWNEILALPVEDVVRFLRESSERATRLRQSSPFPGVLTEQERMEVLAKFSISRSSI
jgi:hypothetical protein